jgi:hypothetical protein
MEISIDQFRIEILDLQLAGEVIMVHHNRCINKSAINIKIL